jgi:hypothetical protein
MGCAPVSEEKGVGKGKRGRRGMEIRNSGVCRKQKRKRERERQGEIKRETQR